MRLILNIVLAAVIIGLIAFLAQQIYDPIHFKDVKDAREAGVVNKLKEIRTAQLAYRSIVGEFAPNFDTLTQVLRTDSFRIVRIVGNPDKENEEVKREIILVPALDSIQKIGLDLDNLRFVPFADEGTEFKIKAQMIEYKSIEVPVLEVSTPIRTYMKEFASGTYMRYDNSFDPDASRKFGDLNKPSTSGNWE